MVTVQTHGKCKLKKIYFNIPSAVIQYQVKQVAIKLDSNGIKVIIKVPIKII